MNIVIGVAVIIGLVLLYLIVIVFFPVLRVMGNKPWGMNVLEDNIPQFVRYRMD